MTLADRIVVMQGGLVQQVGTPEEIYDRPATTFVAAFMGAPAMNLLAGRVEAGRAVLPDGTALPVGRAAPEGKATIGIRPERLIWLPPNHPSPAAIAGPAAVVEPLGSETLVTLDIAGVELHARVPARSVRRAGEEVRLALEPEDIHLFSTEGARL
jgi:multiple sugar transport system ATP-binding protein